MRLLTRVYLGGFEERVESLPNGWQSMGLRFEPATRPDTRLQAAHPADGKGTFSPRSSTKPHRLYAGPMPWCTLTK